MYDLLLTHMAGKDLDALESGIFSRIQKKLDSLKENPRTIGCTKLTNTEVYRVRVGSCRIIYEIDDKLKEITVSRVKHRKEAYR
jgi:mRNA interferase RelE/StbE